MLYRCPKCKASNRTRGGGAPICDKCKTPMVLASDLKAETLFTTIVPPRRSNRPRSPKKPTRLFLRTLPKAFGLLNSRSGSAPPIHKKKLSFNKTNASKIYHDLFVKSKWFNSANKGIRLVYERLDPDAKSTDPQGIWIRHPRILSSTDQNLHDHFEHIACEMFLNHKTTTATEGTGEAAAAYAVAIEPRYSGFQMLWGKHVHGGAGIDQIYHNPTPPAQNRPDGTYLIVEAKGVGAKLGYDGTLPNYMQDQMSEGWIYHNLIKHSHHHPQLFATLMGQVGLSEQYQIGTNPNHKVPFVTGHAGSSTNYYNCQHDPTVQTAQLRKMVVTAQWNDGCQLSYQITDEQIIHP